MFAQPGSFKRRVLRLMLAEKRALRWLLAVILIESSIGLASPWLSAHVIDSALPDEASSMLAIIVALVATAALHAAWAGYLRAKLMATLITKVEADCLTLVLERFLRMDYSLASRRDFGSTHETMSAVSSTSTALMQAALECTAQVVSVCLTVALIAWWFPALAVTVVVATAIMLALASLYAYKEARLAQSTLEASSRQRQTLHVLLGALASLRVLGASGRAGNDWQHELRQHTEALVRQEGAQVAQEVVFEAFPRLISLGATAWFVSDVMAGRASLGEMMMGVMLVSGAMGAIVSLATTAVGFQALRPHFSRVDEVLGDSHHSTANEALLPAELDAQEGLVVEGVWFRYSEQGRWILRDHNLTLPALQLTELRAASGTGKTTILRLLSGLLKPERGSVRVLGRDPYRCKGLVSYLPQQSMLLEASIATNLRALSGRPLEECLGVAEHTGLVELLLHLPMGVETVLSLSGGNLSAGQRQLILLTATFAQDRPVVLLDEAMSQLDHDARDRIDWAKLAHGKTVVVVRHD